ncbi:TIGR04086 family membrane protein [Bacillus smithii]|uniref:TIGR04086 family membrane protein n=1 Tax=Bacillus smithii TaxID=1479 RepID=UPI0030C9D486
MQRQISAVLYGVIAILIMAIASSLIFATILRLSQLTEHSIQLLVTIISFFSLFIGGYITGGKGKEKGLLLGAFTGIVYSSIIFLYQFLGYDSIFSLKQLIFHLGYIATAMLGSVLGVNLSGGKTKES